MTDTVITGLRPGVITRPSLSHKPTYTWTPSPTTISSTKTLSTLHVLHFAPSAYQFTATHTASCSEFSRLSLPDPTARLNPTLSFDAHGRSAERGPPSNEPAGAAELGEWLQDRSARIETLSALSRRAPDLQPLVVTNTVTSDWVTIESTSVARAATVTATGESQPAVSRFSCSQSADLCQVHQTATETVTPPFLTVLKGHSTADGVTETAPVPTRTWHEWTLETQTATKTVPWP